MNVIVTKLKVWLLQGKEKVGPYKVYGVTLRAPAITTRQSTRRGRQNKKAYQVTNSQNMYKWENSLFLQYLTPFEHICLSVLVF